MHDSTIRIIKQIALAVTASEKRSKQTKNQNKNAPTIAVRAAIKVLSNIE